jgi:Domain of unknown function (DUF4349)
MRYGTFLALLAVIGVCLGIAACSKQYAPAMETMVDGAPSPSLARNVAGQRRAEQRVAGKAMDFAEGETALGEDKQAGVNLSVLADSQPDRYLIKDALLTIEVDDARAASDSLVATVKSAGGYVGQLLEHEDSLGVRSVSMQVRVPADRFEDSMRQFEPLGKILQKQITTRDVTEEFVDTDAKVRNLKRTEERVLDHLNRTAKLEDILQVEQELSRYRERIEQMEGRLRFLNNRVAFSTIQITIQEKAKAGTIVPPESFSTGKVFAEATRSLVGFGRVLWVKVIWLLVWSPVWMPLAAIAYLIYRRHIKPALKLPQAKSE